ncbi:RNA polymerase sigma factor [Pararhizobium sp. DWP3-4]|uniref:RNA polymerase sigma factor n=1 Tax=Pararhizobium sp. DWP3-4 TaxID=2804565 RepID=UPI003CF33298
MLSQNFSCHPSHTSSSKRVCGDLPELAVSTQSITPKRPYDRSIQHAAVEKAELIQDATSRRDALRAFFRRRISDQCEIDDLVQDVLLRIVSCNFPETISNTGGYLYRIAGSVLTDRHRRRVVRCAAFHTSFEPDLHGGLDCSSHQILEDRQSLSAALAALAALPARTRTVFLLRRVDGLSYKEISHQFGISVSAVEKHVNKAILHMSYHRQAWDAE